MPSITVESLIAPVAARAPVEAGSARWALLQTPAEQSRVDELVLGFVGLLRSEQVHGLILAGAFEPVAYVDLPAGMNEHVACETIWRIGQDFEDESGMSLTDLVPRRSVSMGDIVRNETTGSVWHAVMQGWRKIFEDRKGA
jgi:hypothetical protein